MLNVIEQENEHILLWVFKTNVNNIHVLFL